MSVAPGPTVALQHRFASDLPEMAVRWQAQTVSEPRLLALNTALADELGLDPTWLQSSDGSRFLVGNEIPDGAAPVAQAYAGHQFGGYVPRLGDGRALLLGELTSADDRLHDIHLKGSGATPFARGGDGLAAVGPMLREYIVSEAMHALGIPTTQSLAVVSTGRLVQRETPLPGAVLTRIASSHLRVGSFEYAAATRNLDLLRRLADHAIARHYPGAAMLDNPYLALFEAVAAVQASLIARWMLVGFVHGVMNTDNMTISGETIDYGPCAFMEAYDPDTVFSSIDHWGRYAYDNQPAVAGWNLARFAESLLPLLADTVDEGVALAQNAFQVFRDQYDATWTDGMRAKLGLPADTDASTVASLTEGLLALLKESRVDYTSFFRALSRDADHLDVAGIDEWVRSWRGLNPDVALMDRSNPIYIPRNHLVEEALTAATTGDLNPFQQLVFAISAPFDERPGMKRYAAAAPDEFGVYRTFCGT